MKKHLTSLKAILLAIISFFLFSTNTVQAKELTNVISGINLWNTSEGSYVS